MNASSKKFFLLGLLLTGIFTLLCTGFSAYALLFTYTPSLGYFESGVFSDVFLPLLYILALVAFLVFGFLFRSPLSGRVMKTTLPHIFASGFAALSTTVWLISFLPAFFSAELPLVQTVLGLLLILSAIATICYFSLGALPLASHAYTLFLGLGAVLFALLYAFYAYFDAAFAMGSPIKLFDQLTMLVFVLFFLAEGRFRFGAISEAAFLPICMSACVFSGAGSISGLIYMIVEGRPLFPIVMHDFLLFGLFLYALTRQLSFLLPAFAPTANQAEQPESASAFEAQGAPSSTPAASPYAQETFDFDQERNGEDAPAASTPPPSSREEDDDGTAQATLDLDSKQ